MTEPEKDARPWRVEIDHKGNEPATCKVWLGGTLVFSGVDWSILTCPIPPGSTEARP